MSADQGSAVVPAAEGPTVITVQGQDEFVAPSEPVVEVPAVPAAEVPEVKPAAGSEEGTGEEESNRDEKGRFKPGVQNRIDELTRARREAEREAEYWRVRAQGAPSQPAAAAAPTKDQPPARESFASDAEYIDALADFKVDQKLAQRDQKQLEVAAQQTKAQSWQEKMAAARSEIEGFDDVMNATEAPVAGHVAELIMEHDHGAKVAHFLASNPDQLEKMNEMSPAKAAFEIARIATKFEVAAAAPSSKPAAEQAVSKAPPPAARAVGQGRATTPELGDLSMDDYVARRKAQGASWAR